MIRNILEHSHENPKAMKAQCKKEQPFPEDIFLCLSEHLPVFYLHSLYCYNIFFQHREMSMPTIFLDTFKELEAFWCQEGLAQESLLPLQQQSCVTISFRSLSGINEKVLQQTHTLSIISLKDVFPQILEELSKIWPAVTLNSLVFTCHWGNISNLLATTPSNDASQKCVDSAVLDSIKILEGTTIYVQKPEVMIQINDQVQLSACQGIWQNKTFL